MNININKIALAHWAHDSQKNVNPFTQNQIKEIEKLVSRKLPSDLVHFLMKYSGVDLGLGVIDDPVAFFVAKVTNGTKFFAGVEVDKYAEGISCFITFEQMVNVYTTLTNDSPHFDASARIPEYMLPLDFEGRLFINLSQQAYGEISLWDPIEETWGNEYNNSMDFVANSFTEFVESLTTLDEAESRLVNT